MCGSARGGLCFFLHSLGEPSLLLSAALGFPDQHSTSLAFSLFGLELLCGDRSFLVYNLIKFWNYFLTPSFSSLFVEGKNPGRSDPTQ